MKNTKNYARACKYVYTGIQCANDNNKRYRRAVEGEETLKIVEKVSEKNDIFDRQIRISRCDVLPDSETRRGRITTIEAYLLSVFRESVARAMYVHLYGRPEPLHAAPVADLDYMRSIVKTVMRTVFGEIFTRRTAGKPSDPSRVSTSSCSGSGYGPQSSASWDAPYSRVQCDGSSDRTGRPGVVGNERTMLAEPVWSDTGKTPAGRYGVRVPPNHKDYWKFTKIYESIAK